MNRSTTGRIALVAVLTLCVIGAADDDAGAGDDASKQKDDLNAAIAEILAGPDDAAYVEPERCIIARRIDRTEVLSDRVVVFHMRGGEKYVVQFEHRCPGLRRNGLTRQERRSIHLCAHDTIQGLYDISMSGAESWGPRCFLPHFEPVTAEQVTFIKEALKSRRR